MVAFTPIVMVNMVVGGINMDLTDFTKQSKKKPEKKIVNGIWVESEEEKKNWEEI